MAEQMFLIEARRARRGDRPAGIARFIVTAGSRYAALSKLHFNYDTTEADSLTATPISGVIPISGAMVHEMLRPAPEEARTQHTNDASDDDEDEPWRGSA